MKRFLGSGLLIALSTFGPVPYAVADTAYGYLLTGDEGYKVWEKITSDPSNPLLDYWSSGEAKMSERHWIKFKLDTLDPPMKGDFKLNSCRSPSHWQPAWPSCGLYQGRERQFVNVRKDTPDYSKLEFYVSDFRRAVRDALKKHGYDPVGSDKEAWLKYVRDLEDALSRNRLAEQKTYTDVMNQVRSAEKEMEKFAPLIAYEPFNIKKKADINPNLFLELATFHAEQDAERDKYAKGVIADFEQYFAPLRIGAEIQYPKKLAENKAAEEARQKQQRADAIEAEKREKAAEAERQKQAALEAKRVANFRAGIKVETETNCGPVLALRGKLIQIFSPISGYSSEHWIRRNDLFPSGYSCRFINGNYIGPN